MEQSNPIHFDEKGGKAARKFGESVLHIDFDVDGKRANSPDGEVTALETTPGTYIFHIKRPDGTHYYNNQYFVNENERRIIGPYTEGDLPKIAGVLSQVFTRLSTQCTRHRFTDASPIRTNEGSMTGHAIVIGGGIGGLLAGHGLSRHYAKVTILERFGYSPETWSQAPPRLAAALRKVDASIC